MFSLAFGRCEHKAYRVPFAYSFTTDVVYLTLPLVVKSEIIWAYYKPLSWLVHSHTSYAVESLMQFGQIKLPSATYPLPQATHVSSNLSAISFLSTSSIYGQYSFSTLLHEQSMLLFVCVELKNARHTLQANSALSLNSCGISSNFILCLLL